MELSLAEWTRAKDANKLMTQLRSNNIDATVLNSIPDLLSDPHLIFREYMQYVDRDFVGSQPHPSSPLDKRFQGLLLIEWG
tara:strand:+ start:175 stop:417 length:243 start_codon:yes stop_codon:yes gene_type:complete